MIQWDQFKNEIFKYSREKYSSPEILEKLIDKHGNIFPRSSGRTIRKIVSDIQEENDAEGAENTGAKILVFDLETAPAEAYIWNKFQGFVPDNMIINDWFVLCWSAKWLFGDEIYNSTLSQKELKNRDDSRIMKNLWSLIDEASIILAHNCKGFDEKKMNTRFLKHDLGRPSPYQTIDTLIHARKKFAITSNKLDYLAEKFFEIDGKHDTATNLWYDVMQGDYESLKIMQEYCDNDVKVLENVYLQMRGWISPHPNVALQAVAEEDCCPVCSSTDREKCNTPYRTYVNEYEAYRCKNCSHIYRSRTSNTPLKEHKKLKVSIPK